MFTVFWILAFFFGYLLIWRNSDPKRGEKYAELSVKQQNQKEKKKKKKNPIFTTAMYYCDE